MEPYKQAETSECDMCFIGKMGKCEYVDETDDNNDSDNDSGDVSRHDDGDDDDDVDENAGRINILDTVNPGQVIALRTPCEVHNSFYLCVVERVDITDMDIFDSYQYFVTKSQRYIVCKYLSKVSESRKCIKHKKLPRDVFILPGEVLCPFVDMGDDYTLTWEEKQWLDDCA